MDPFVATTRFGLGPMARDLERAARDPLAFLLNQIEAGRSTAGPPAVAGPALDGIVARALGAAAALDAANRALHAEGGPPPGVSGIGGTFDTAQRELANIRRGTFRQELAFRVRTALTTERPLVERLALFFSNHFAVGRDKLDLFVLAGHHERTIRAHVLGRFRDLLGAAVLHPAMLVYLDNVESMGPRSHHGRHAGRSINENLARELLELHTLGVDGGYTEDDVVALALVLTGWTGGFHIDFGRAPEEQRLGEAFLQARHEPGAKTIGGKTYPEAGPAEIGAVLDDLAAHPATARHVSAKLARHFVGDEVSEATVAHLADTFRETDGDLAAVMRALVTTQEAWTAPPRKVVPPYDVMVSAARAFGQPFRFRSYREVLATLGYKVWLPPSPAGWPDGDESWISGDMLLERVDWATSFATGVAPERESIEADARVLLGDGLDGDLLATIRRAEGRVQALTLLLMSPQWQVR